MTDKEKEFEEYKLIHYFLYGDDEHLKKWFNVNNVSNIYKTDWNALMKVVERIETLGYTTLIKFYGDEYSNFVEILNTDEDPLQICCFTAHVVEEPKISLVYKAVIEFIKYYNEINNKE